jgi:hypothetical protein
MTPRAQHCRGAALVVALAILGLLVLLAVSLGATVRLRFDSAHAATRRAQARDHALVALEMARARLGAWAGPEDRITGPGAGLEPTMPAFRGPAQVWTSDGTWLGELSSGRVAPDSTASRVTLVAAMAGVREALEVAGFSLSGDAGDGWGGFAVFDEGTKLAVRPGSFGDEGIRLRASSGGPLGAFQAIAAADAALVRRMVAFGQLALVASPSLVRAAADELVLEAGAGGDDGATARLTVNTDSPAVWQAVLEAAGIPAADEIAPRVAAAVAGFAADGKAGSGPFTDLAAVRVFVAAVVPLEPEAEASAWARIEPLLAVRSDGFRVRAAGVVVGPGEGGDRTIARLEATLRRDRASGRFRVTGFRWLAPDDP